MVGWVAPLDRFDVQSPTLCRFVRSRNATAPRTHPLSDQPEIMLRRIRNMDVGGVIFAALVILGAIPFALSAGKTHGTEKTVSLAGVGAALGVGVVNLLKAAGWLA